MFRLIRMFGLLFAVWAALRLFLDFNRTVMNGRHFRMQRVSEVWTEFNPDSLKAAEKLAREYLGDGFWDSAMVAILATGMSGLLAIIAVILLMITNREAQSRGRRLRMR